MSPFSLSDAELDVIMNLAAPLNPVMRDPFLRAIVRRCRGMPPAPSSLLFPCASHIRHSSVCSKGKCMKMRFFSVSFIFAIVAIDA